MAFCHAGWETATDDIEKARMVYVTLCQNFVGQTAGGSWGFCGPNGKENKAQTFKNSLENIRLVTNRLKNVMIENHPALTVMKQWDHPDTLIYADPPIPSRNPVKATW
jgi:site-specific DNA-adenine methylase